MRRRGSVLIAATVALAAAVAGAGAAANLHLLEPHRSSYSTVVLGTSTTKTSTTTIAGGPTSTDGEPADDPTIDPEPGEPTTTTVTTPPTTGTTQATTLRRTYVVGQAGSVTVVVQAGALAVDSVAPSARWTYAIEHQGPDEVEIRFRRTTGEEATFKATIESGAIRVEIEADEGEPPDD